MKPITTRPLIRQESTTSDGRKVYIETDGHGGAERYTSDDIKEKMRKASEKAQTEEGGKQKLPEGGGLLG